MVGIPVLILIIIGGAYSQGYFDNAFESWIVEEPIEKEVKPADTISSSETNSKCGAGTVFDEDTNSCVLESKIDSKEKEPAPSENNSKCGPGTVFDPDANSCVLDK